MSNTSKVKALVTPTGSALWAKVTEPQANKFNPTPMFSMSVVFKPEEVEVFKGKMQDLLNEFYDETFAEIKPAKQKSLAKADLFREAEDKDGSLTGELELRTKQFAKDFKGNEQIMPIVDSTGKDITNGCPLVGNGSKVRAKVFPKLYYMASTNTVGISFRLNAVQIVELVEYGNASTGFDAVDGGYVAPTTLGVKAEDIFQGEPVTADTAEDLDF
jgi:hypothetical protein